MSRSEALASHVTATVSQAFDLLEIKRNDRADRLAGKATITTGLRLERSQVLKSLRHYRPAQSQGPRAGGRCGKSKR